MENIVEQANASFEASFNENEGGGLAAAASARVQFQEALDMIPPQEKEAYLEAVRRVPHLVETESDATRFLRFEKDNPWAAAHRLVTYWERRKSIFGERAFLPMHSTGNGALNEKDIRMLNTGILAPLPKDTAGRSVVFINRSLLEPDMWCDCDTKVRIFFYIMSVLAENEKTQTEGAVFLYLATTPRKGEGVDFRFPPRGIDLISRAMPMKALSVDVLSLPINPGGFKVLAAHIAYMFHMIGKFLGIQCHVHRGDDAEDLLKQLRGSGLWKRFLPTCIGGDWSHEKFVNWRTRKIKVEQNAYFTPEQQLDRKRKINAIHSRQKRNRRKIEKEVLQDQCDDLRHRNAAVLAKNEALEALLEQAHAQVAIHGRAQIEGQEQDAAPSPLDESSQNHSWALDEIAQPVQQVPEESFQPNLSQQEQQQEVAPMEQVAPIEHREVPLGGFTQEQMLQQVIAEKRAHAETMGLLLQMTNLDQQLYSQPAMAGPSLGGAPAGQQHQIPQNMPLLARPGLPAPRALPPQPMGHPPY